MRRLIFSFYFIVTTLCLNVGAVHGQGINFGPGQIPPWLFIPIDQINLEDLFKGLPIQYPPGFNIPGNGSSSGSSSSSSGSAQTPPDTIAQPPLKSPVFLLPSHPNKPNIDTSIDSPVPTSEPLCSSWNSFLNLISAVLEFTNHSNSEKQIAFRFYSQEGTIRYHESIVIPAYAVRDILLHELPVWEKDQIGTVCIDEAPEITFAITTYKLNIHSTEPDFILSRPAVRGTQHAQVIGLNTIYPSEEISDFNLPVNNWIEITNVSQKAERGTLSLFSENGSKIQESEILLDPFARLDIPGHLIGSKAVGSAHWQPENDSARFIVRSSRYYYDNSTSQESFRAALILPAQTSLHNVFSLDSLHAGYAVLELANASAHTNRVSIQLSDENDSQVYFIELAPHSTQHLLISQLTTKLAPQTDVESKYPLFSSLLYYQENDKGLFTTATATSASISSQNSLHGRYNSHLGLECFLHITNNSAHEDIARIIMRESTDTILLGNLPQTFNSDFSKDTIAGEPVLLRAYETTVFNICEHAIPNTTGTIRLFTDNHSTITATLVRQNTFGTTFLREQLEKLH